MKSFTTLQDAYEYIAQAQHRDNILTHLLCAVPEDRSFVVVEMRNPLSIAFAIARTNITPVSHIGAIELAYLRKVEDFEDLTVTVVDLLSLRGHSGELINMIEAYNILTEEPPETDNRNGIPSES